MDLELIKRINESPFKVFVAITGGGQSFIGSYLSVSGGSNTILGALVPYSQACFDEFVNGSVDQYCSSEAARKLAVASYNKCLKYGARWEHAIGIGVTSSLVKDNEREGREHKFFIATHTYNKTMALDFRFLKRSWVRTRLDEEDNVSYHILEAIKFIALNEPMKVWDLEVSMSQKISWDTNHQLLVHGSKDLIPHADLSGDTLAIYSGSWNPVHNGHRGIMLKASEILGVQPILELSVVNADKGQLDFIEIDNRTNELKGYPYVLTNVSTFKQKLDLFDRYYPKAKKVFVMGADTWNRIWEAKYGFDPEVLEDYFERKEVKFLVFPREGYRIYEAYGRNLLIKDKRLQDYKPNNLSSTVIRRDSGYVHPNLKK